jgi:hypothetical protein
VSDIAPPLRDAAAPVPPKRFVSEKILAELDTEFTTCSKVEKPTARDLLASSKEAVVAELPNASDTDEDPSDTGASSRRPKIPEATIDPNKDTGSLEKRGADAIGALDTGGEVTLAPLVSPMGEK